MALPATRPELLTYIKTRLGEPVITVNVSNTQIEQRIDDAFSLWHQYHVDASKKVYIRQIITPSNITFSTASTGTFTNNEFVVGQTSNAIAKLHVQTTGTDAQFSYKSKPVNTAFIVGETIVGQQSNASATVNSISLGIWDSEKIPISNNIIAVNQVLRNTWSMIGGGERATGLFSLTFPMIAADLQSMGGAGQLTSYHITRSHLELLHDQLVGDISHIHAYHENAIYLNVAWDRRLVVNDWIVIEAMEIVDPALYSKIYSDRFIRDYATALVKKQWGQNLMKYQGVQMPGGVMLNGTVIYEEGTREAEKLEKEMQQKYEPPLPFYLM